MNLKVESLSAEAQDGLLLLDGVVVSKEGEERGVKTAETAGCKIDHGAYPLDSPPCEGCPIRFITTHTVEGRLVEGERFHCGVRVPLPEGIHFFRVRLTGTRGETGPPSQTAKLVMEAEEDMAP